MSFVRHFAGADSIKLAMGANNTPAAVTYAALIRPAKLTGGADETVVSSYTAGNAFAGYALEFQLKHSVLYGNGGGAFSTPMLFEENNVWMLLVVTKAAGASKVTFHRFIYDGTPEWEHQESVGTTPNAGEAPGGIIYIGNENGSEFYSGNIAAISRWSYAMTQAEVEALASVSSLTAWKTIHTEPTGLWLFNQKEVAEEVKDQTAGGANQTARTGTSVVEEAPPIPFTATPPEATTEAASGVGIHGATLNGKVNPQGTATTYFYEYGPTKAYGSFAPAGKNGNAGEGSAAKSVPEAVSGLAANTTYHFRLIAQSAAGEATGADQTLTTESEPVIPVVPSPSPSPPSPFTVVAIAEGGKGRGYDLTDEAEGLSFSNVDPGGDEVCTFTLHRSWFAENPEIEKGNLIRVMASIDTVWVGRIEDVDRATGDSETVAVTAYGLGNRLGDVTFREIYVDQDLSKWGAMPNPRVVALGKTWQTNAGNFEVKPGSTGAPSLALSYTQLANTATSTGIIEAWYDAAGIEIGRIYLGHTDFEAGVGYGAGLGSWIAAVAFSPDQANPGAIGSSLTGAAGTYSAAAPAGQFYILAQFYFAGEFSGTSEWRLELYPLAVYGTHALAGKGTQPYGFSADQIAGHMAQKASGITLRNVESFPYVIPQFTVMTPTTPKDGIATVNEYANADYGVWGPESPLDPTTNGYFDFTIPDTGAQQWLVTRSQFEGDLSFHTELSSLYDTVDVHWTDIAGAEHTERFSITSPDLQAAGLSPRIYPLEAGKTTQEGAQILAEIFLDIFAGFAPARGSGTLAGKITHYQRGKIPSYYLRADGSNMRIPDILPAETTFSLDSTPDRRTTFPIKRVTVDCSGDVPKTSVELDQSTEALSVRLAQEAAQAELVG